jgi:curved DNA-binding protein
MLEDGPFVDYYEILQVQPTCDGKILEAAYRHLAKMYHPDRVETADIAKFNAVIEAFSVLRHPAQRAEYDLLRTASSRASKGRSPPSDQDDTKWANNDAEAHDKILLSLYKRRREHAQDAGVAAFYVQRMLNCSDEHLDFHVWYLRAKGFIEVTEQGTLAITIQGVDHVLSTSRAMRAEKLMIGRSDEFSDQSP